MIAWVSEAVMKEHYRINEGVEKLIKNYRKSFRIPENLNYYSAEDFKNAERQFVKYQILKGKV